MLGIVELSRFFNFKSNHQVYGGRGAAESAIRQNTVGDDEMVDTIPCHLFVDRFNNIPTWDTYSLRN